MSPSGASNGSSGRTTSCSLRTRYGTNAEGVQVLLLFDDYNDCDGRPGGRLPSPSSPTWRSRDDAYWWRAKTVYGESPRLWQGHYATESTNRVVQAFGCSSPN